MKTYLKNKDYETDAELLGQMNGVTSTEFKYLRGHIDFVNGFYIDQSIDQFIVEYRGYLAPSIGGKLGLSWLQNEVEICPGIKLPRHAWAYVQIYNDVFLNDTADQTVCNWETSNRDGGRDIYSGYMNVGSSGNMNLDKMYAHQLYPFRLVFYNSEESLEARFEYYDVATFEHYTLSEENSFYSPNDNYEYRDANANSGWPRICPTFDVTDTLTPTPQPPFVTQPYTCPASSTSEVSVSTSESPMISSNRPPTTSSEMSSATSAIPDLSSSELPIVSSEVPSSNSNVPLSSSTSELINWSSEPPVLSSTFVPQHSSNIITNPSSAESTIPSISYSASSVTTSDLVTTITTDEPSSDMTSISTDLETTKSSFVDSSVMENSNTITSTFSDFETSIHVESSTIEKSADSSNVPSSVNTIDTNTVTESPEPTLIISSNEETNINPDTLSSSAFSVTKTNSNEYTMTSASTAMSNPAETQATKVNSYSGVATDALSETDFKLSTNTLQVDSSKGFSSSPTSIASVDYPQEDLNSNNHYQTVLSKTVTSCGSTCVTDIITVTVEWCGTTSCVSQHETTEDAISAEQFTTAVTDHIDNKKTETTAYEQDTVATSIPNYSNVAQWSSSTFNSPASSFEQFFNQANKIDVGSIFFILLTCLLL
ncbi:hypothetical protein C6P45_000568 [Maudiozyma exigua]|uniref:Uncharacterized protein n=1 Tax=Maudiozyma exigua TaxID=34358 RepID=A0A9P6W4L7_MAUEX|nr:hypothetical protein C6P45_000568 [Kazachstania exigua]